MKNRSKKRDAILRCLRGTVSHPTAEWVYQQLNPELPDLSRGTVYRNLAVFCEEGMARCVATENSMERFDGNAAPHTHFICERCGAISDLFEIPVPPPAQGDWGRADFAELTFRGVCAACLKQPTETKNKMEE